MAVSFHTLDGIHLAGSAGGSLCIIPYITLLGYPIILSIFVPILKCRCHFPGLHLIKTMPWGFHGSADISPGREGVKSGCSIPKSRFRDISAPLTKAELINPDKMWTGRCQSPAWRTMGSESSWDERQVQGWGISGRTFAKNYKWHCQESNHLISVFTRKHLEAEMDMIILDIKDLPVATPNLNLIFTSIKRKSNSLNMNCLFSISLNLIWFCPWTVALCFGDQSYALFLPWSRSVSEWTGYWVGCRRWLPHMTLYRIWLQESQQWLMRDMPLGRCYRPLGSSESPGDSGNLFKSIWACKSWW